MNEKETIKYWKHRELEATWKGLLIQQYTDMLKASNANFLDTLTEQEAEKHLDVIKSFLSTSFVQKDRDIA